MVLRLKEREEVRASRVWSVSICGDTKDRIACDGFGELVVVINETRRNREDVLLKTDSGQVLGLDESATLLAETFFLNDRQTDVADIKVIPKLGKDDYGRPKSCHPIVQIPTLGKIMERMLIRCLQWHLVPKLCSMVSRRSAGQRTPSMI
ncbi:hypothetical protein EVAR_47092_1 [Eumeta japonica]|uniref:Uncharacterized protein n=1 Tax=Eumeta variegata TaxID=151549 RepID=A0A4C1YC13_EUMVA|nr:hypothetical protein EVAR_47092_1 [Eumeta japonica]